VIIPIGDEPNPRGTPWVNYLLIAANVVVFLLITLPLMMSPPDPNDPATLEYVRWLLQKHPELQPSDLPEVLHATSAYDIFLMQWGYRPAAPSALTLLISMFLHGGWLHLIGNMLFLWIYGDNVEHRLGRLGYLAAYLATGALAALSYGALAPASAGNVPMVGASGAISGVLGFYFIWFPRNRVRLLFLLFPFFVFTWRVSARIVLGFFLIIENLLPALLAPSGSGGGVAYGAHIGGFVAGLAAAVLLDGLGRLWGRRQAREEVGPAEEPGQAAGLDAVLAARQAGDLRGALRAYLSLEGSARRRVPAEVATDLADYLASHQQTDSALALYRQVLNDHPRGPGLDRVFLGVGQALLYGKNRPTAAYQYLMDALDADPRPEVEQAARAALADIARLQKFPVQSRRRW